LDALQLSLAVGGAELSPLGTRDATFPAYAWVGQLYVDLGARYDILEGGGLFALGAGRLSFFTADAAELGGFAGRGPLSVGLGAGTRLSIGIPLELALRLNLGAATEVELSARLFVF
jgi:hypothetical protein